MFRVKITSHRGLFGGHYWSAVCTCGWWTRSFPLTAAHRLASRHLLAHEACTDCGHALSAHDGGYCFACPKPRQCDHKGVRPKNLPSVPDQGRAQTGPHEVVS